MTPRPLPLRPPNGRYPSRWLPRHGKPVCMVEWLSQNTVKLLAHLPVYTAVVATLTLLVLIFGLPGCGS